VLIAVTAV